MTSSLPTVSDAAAGLAVLEPAASLDDVLGFYDSLPPVTVEQMLGSWCGNGITTGNPFDGLLEHYGWHGKRYESADDAHPLVFPDPRGGLLSVNPALVPLGLVARYGPRLHADWMARASEPLRSLIRTRKPRARLRMTEYRGVVTGTMSYDALPINDVFRRVDQDTMLGLMDMRGLEHPFAFVLRREG